jgi:hypothetical protein
MPKKNASIAKKSSSAQGEGALAEAETQLKITRIRS